MENHAKESIKHKIVLPNSKTINIEGTNFKYEIHHDQLDEKDLLMIEKYANHIFHAYQEKYGLDINTDRTFKGFIYNSLTDLRNAHLRYDVAHAGADFHHCHYNSGSIAYNLTSVIESTLTLYNQEKRGIPYPEGRYTFITDVAKELKSIRLDDNQEESKKVESSDSGREEKSRPEEISPEKHQTINQEESNSAEKPEITINQKEQEESKKVESSGSEEEKIKLDEKKSGQEKISPETVLPDLNNSDNNKEESNTAEKPETTIYQEKQEESKKVEPSCSGGEEKSKVEEEKSYQEKEKISPETVLPDLNNSDNNQEEPNTAEKPETTINQGESKDVEPSGPEEEGKSKVKEEKSSQEEISLKTVLPDLNNSDNNQEEPNTAEKSKTTINQEESKKVEPSDSGREEKSGQEEISPEKHKVELPNSKTINIEGTNFKYEIHHDQLDEKDLLMIEKYANHIFHAYQEKYGLDINTDRTFKGFIYNSLTDLRNAHLRYDVAHAGADFHHCHYNSGSIAYNLTSVIESTLTLYNQEKRGIPYPEGRYTFITDVAKELKSIRLDDNQEESKKVESSDSGREEKSRPEEISPEKHQTINQEESNSAEKPEITINQKEQEESKKVESSGSEEEKIKLDEKKSGQEEISPKTVLPHSKTINIEGTNFKYEIHYDQLDEKDLLTIEKYANHIFHAYQARYGLDMNTDHTVKGFTYNNLANLSDDDYDSITADYHEYHYHSESIANDLTTMIYVTLNLYNEKNYGTSSPRGEFIRDVAEELKNIGLDDNQGELNTEERPKTTINQEKQEKELKESDQQDVITTTDHPLDDYNHDYHLIG